MSWYTHVCPLKVTSDCLNTTIFYLFLRTFQRWPVPNIWSEIRMRIVARTTLVYLFSHSTYYTMAQCNDCPNIWQKSYGSSVLSPQKVHLQKK